MWAVWQNIWKVRTPKLTLVEMIRLHRVIKSELSSVDNEKELSHAVLLKGMDFFYEVGTIIFREKRWRLEKEFEPYLLVLMQKSFSINLIFSWRKWIRDVRDGEI